MHSITSISNTTATNTPTWDVIIIGGGFTGVHAACQIELQQPGARVLLLEAASELGGRTRSVTAGDHCALDLGAHYFGIQHRRVNALAQRLAPEAIYPHLPCYGANPSSRIWLEGQWRPLRRSDSYLDIQGLSRRVSWEHRARIFESLLNYLKLEARIDPHEPWNSQGANELDTQTVADWISAQRVPRWIHEMWTIGIRDIMSIYPEQISLLYWLWYNKSNGGFLTLANDFAGGPQEMALSIGMQGLLFRHAAERRGPIRCATPVHAIDYRLTDRVILHTASGESLHARQVVVAITPSAARHIHFTPEVSAPRVLLHAQPVGHAAKVVARYAEPWWRDCDAHHFNVFCGGADAKDIEWYLDTSHPDGRQYSLSGFISPTLLDQTGSDPQARRDAVVDATAQLCGDSRAKQPLQIDIWAWRDQPWIGGGPNTCLGPSVLTRLSNIFNVPEGPNGRLHFAAAEYSTEYTGYLEGALACAELVSRQVCWSLSGDLGMQRPPTLPGRPQIHRWPSIGWPLLAAAWLPACWAADAARALRGSEPRL